MVSSKYKATAEIPRSNFDNVGSIPTMSTKLKSVSEIKSGTQTKLIPEPMPIATAT